MHRPNDVAAKQASACLQDRSAIGLVEQPVALVTILPHRKGRPVGNYKHGNIFAMLPLRAQTDCLRTHSLIRIEDRQPAP